MFAEHFPQLFPQFMRARQQVEHFGVAQLNYLHVPVAALAIAGLGIALFGGRWKIAPRKPSPCAWSFCSALAANAAICGVFSHPVDRYQSRMVLLAPARYGIVDRAASSNVRGVICGLTAKDF